MATLSILLSTINDRLFAASKILTLPLEGVEFIVVHQLTDGHIAESYQNFYDQFTNGNIKFIPRYEKGTGRSRNIALQAAKNELLYLCDDDLKFEPEFLLSIHKNTSQFPTADIYTFQVRTTEGNPFKSYPARSYWHTIRTAATVSIVEMVIKKSAVEKGIIHFDERFGLATEYNTGEEFVMLTDALRKGATAVFIPEFIVQHPPISSGKIFNAAAAFDKGAMIARVYGWKCFAINVFFSVRKYKEYRHSIGFIRFISQMYKGSFHFLRHD